MNRADERGSQACPARHPRHDAIGATITPICVHLPTSGLLIRRLACILSILQPQPAASGPRGRQICGRGPWVHGGLSWLSLPPPRARRPAPLRAPRSPIALRISDKTRCVQPRAAAPPQPCTHTHHHASGVPSAAQGCLRTSRRASISPSRIADVLVLTYTAQHSWTGRWHSASQCHPSVTALSSRHSRHTTPIPNPDAVSSHEPRHDQRTLLLLFPNVYRVAPLRALPEPLPL